MDADTSSNGGDNGLARPVKNAIVLRQYHSCARTSKRHAFTTRPPPSAEPQPVTLRTLQEVICVHPRSSAVPFTPPHVARSSFDVLSRQGMLKARYSALYRAGAALRIQLTVTEGPAKGRIFDFEEPN